MKPFRVVNEEDKSLILGCFNTVLLLAENNIYNLQHKKEPLMKHEETALMKLIYEKNSIELLKHELLETIEH